MAALINWLTGILFLGLFVYVLASGLIFVLIKRLLNLTGIILFCGMIFGVLIWLLSFSAVLTLLGFGALLFLALCLCII